ncbi:mitochondrial ribonuclease P protein 1 homolog [Tribolium castaneum]|uniref:RNA (guanine-9-)-methyltransferase domain-containing protein 1 n=1 Tax=Tribolium castaneum TaxID=7070 RepID=D6WZK2_TRICA|nr:PREDICTED: mitochondrial ribonuclease P protein 1 homolog [Tribolium castaneum]EFA10439.1 Mitochondrial ribonuclease P protein 1 homolog-like Protein [Tribolium castaneum]|eukprot:XP_972549.2 PREDICTED: mitochondrial ribonuclease P protein 1 homolog [Tribolium castaneum]
MFSAVRQSAKLVRLGNFVRVPPYRPPRSFFCAEAAQGPNIEALTNGDKELEHKLKVLILEVDVMRQEGKLVPDDEFLKDKHWKELLELPTYSARKRLLEYLFKISKKKENRLIKKEEKKQQRGDKPEKKENETLEEFVSTYDLAHNNIFLRVYDNTINQLYNNRLVQAMQFGQKLVVDCGYDQDMTVRENKNCAKQLTLLFAENRAHDDPFDLHYCSLAPDTILHETLQSNIATLHEPWFPLNVHETSYLEKFPREQLVYLTPHCREELVKYDHDAIYIIGAIVDKVNTQPLSLAKAKREGLRMAKLPLDRYLQWGSGSGKSLTLNQCVAILLDVKHTGDWEYALRHVPRRKIIQMTDQKEQKSFKSRFWKPGKKLDLSRKDRRVEVRSIMYDEN